MLVANRGEIARRVFATCRRLGLGTVAVYTDPDAAAPHVAEADARVRLPQTNDYLNAEAIIAAARAAGADALHPGYGFLSENADFAAAVQAAGLIWIGPPVDAVRAMGSKIESKKLMAAAGVPVLEELDPETVTEEQLPVLVKASAGGGGRGMRVVRELSTLSAEVEAAQREAQSAFGDPTVFCERYLPTGHHIEVQVMADTHGTVWAVGERECSIQRRHQKVIEEAPSPLVERVAGMRAKLFEAARLAATAIGYTGAGTVEFLADDDGEFFFLEMNTRLQVEHPVTEETTGLDLVELQLDVADGGRLDAEPPAAQGHSIEVRLYAEDPAHGWQPQAGAVHRFHVPSVRAEFSSLGHRTGIRLDSGHRRRLGGVDPLRPDAGQGHLLRPDSPAIGAGARRRAGPRPRAWPAHQPRTVGERAAPPRVPRRRNGHSVFRHSWPGRVVGAAGRRRNGPVVGDRGRAGRRRAQPRTLSAVFGSLPSGWRNLSSGYQVKTYRDDSDTEQHVEYRFTRTALAFPTIRRCNWSRRRRTKWCWPTAGWHPALPSRDSVMTSTSTRRAGPSTWSLYPGFPKPDSAVAQGSLVAPMPGNVIRVGAEVGDTVTAGQPLIWLEAMKMEHTITAPDRRRARRTQRPNRPTSRSRRSLGARGRA